MRKLKLQVQVSIDGYMASTDGKTDWLVWNWGKDWSWDDALRKYFNELTASVDCVLLSRKMAEEGFIGHWAGVAEDPADPQYVFAKKIADARKVVFTRTLHEPQWDNTIIANKDLVEQISQLKSQKGKDIIVYGGATFVSSLIKAKMIDEFHLFVNPALLGEGIPLFKEHGHKQDLTLMGAHPYACGVTVLVYTTKN